MNSKIYPNSTLQVLGLILISFIATTIISLPLFFILKNKQEVIETLMIILYCFLLVGMAYFINRRKRIKLTFNFKLNNRALLPLMFLAIIAFGIGFGIPFNKIITSLLGHSKHGITNPFNLTLYTSSALILAPIIEEIIFRGIILKGLLTNYSPTKAIIISAIIFGIIHIMPGQIFGAFIFGLFAGWIYYKTQSLGITMLLHFTSNLSGLMGSFINFKWGGIGVSSIYGKMTIFYIAISLILLLFSMRYLMRKMKNIPVVS